LAEGLGVEGTGVRRGARRRGLGVDEGRWGYSSTRVVATARRRRGVDVNQGRCRLREVQGGGARRGPLKPAEALDVEGAEARRWWLVGDEGSSRTMCHLKLLTMYTVSLVRLTGSSSTRVVAAARRRRGTPGLLVDEGGRGSPRWLDVDEGGGARRGRSSTRGGGVPPGRLDVDEGTLSSRGAQRRRGLDVNQGRCRLLGDEGGGARRSGSTPTRGWVTPLGWGLLSVAAAGVEPERPGAQSRPWFSRSFPYRKLESGTNRTSPRGAR